MSVNIDMENFSAKKNLRRRTLNTIKSAVTALKQIASECSQILLFGVQHFCKSNDIFLAMSPFFGSIDIKASNILASGTDSIDCSNRKLDLLCLLCYCSAYLFMKRTGCIILLSVNIDVSSSILMNLIIIV